MATTELVPVTEARARMNELVMEIVPKRDVVLVRRSRPVAIVVSPDRYEAMLQRIEDLEDQLSVLEARLSGDKGTPIDEAASRTSKRAV